ncbi:hypothetical protein ABT390_02405 [Streptomyces aurantiacus]|uniref:ATP-grasp domain-containing protein n=1 Tax=Streptomyces aurantiacus JA 4570 TaxID=1286094 RepID=S4A7D7_9ACTN|nr:hypothetical protein [Streptomyces aurantiacus]EPH46680.1 hypothetical protein STRAU_0233 [Streptomyces aurantiacus JA 4570]
MTDRTPAPAARPHLTSHHQVLDDAVEALHRHWRGRRVFLLANQFTHSAQLLIDEVEACGATLAGIISRTHRPQDVAAPVFSFAEHGIELAPHEFEDHLTQAPKVLRKWLDEHDAGRSCTVLGSIWTTMPRLCGRPVHGWRRHEWAAWEDKVRVEQLWADAAVPSPRHTIVPLDAPGLYTEAARLDGGRGVVLAMDSSRGIPGGGGRGLAWVRSRAELDAAVASFAGRADRVRIAEFVPGVPCSTQALALDTGIAVFDPAEEAMLRHPGTGRFYYAGTSTWWRPPAPERRTIEAYVRRTGELLVSLTGYRGIFTVDGLLTARGFLATEMNPRGAGGLGFRPGRPDFPSYLFHRAAQESVPGVVDLPADAVQAAFRDVIAGRPSFSGALTPGSGPAAPAEPGPAPGTHRYTTPRSRMTIDYRYEGTSARVVELTPTTEDGAVGPAVAEFAHFLGNPGLVGFEDDSVRSTLGPAGKHGSEPTVPAAGGTA